MHIPDGLMAPAVLALGWIISLPMLALVNRRMNETLEAMARAIFDTAIGANHWENPWYADERAGCHYSARAALTAALDHMREPSEAMKARACEVDCPRQECAVVLACQGDGKRINKERWQAMLSQLRKEALGDG